MSNVYPITDHQPRFVQNTAAAHTDLTKEIDVITDVHLQVAADVGEERQRNPLATRCTACPEQRLRVQRVQDPAHRVDYTEVKVIHKPEQWIQKPGEWYVSAHEAPGHSAQQPVKRGLSAFEF